MNTQQQRNLGRRELKRIGGFPKTREIVKAYCWIDVILTFVEEADNTAHAVEVLFKIATPKVLSEWAYYMRRYAPGLSSKECLMLSEVTAKDFWWARYARRYAPNLSHEEQKILDRQR